jgi:DNA polymerase-3 subunit epsilon
MPLQLSRPLAFIDLETTGVNLSCDRIVEIAIVKILPDGIKQVKRKIVIHRFKFHKALRMCMALLMIW